MRVLILLAAAIFWMGPPRPPRPPGCPFPRPPRPPMPYHQIDARDAIAFDADRSPGDAVAAAKPAN